ncbi:hypothetical protein [Costertonia aggregata]|uniref:DUF4488 domain-containing protein n=1 Tax=Costertonia aggregata TaxID=343403 RepID=A0A7H9AMN9_9FLAO|nr:hypothetical protein [Costertonia aggregata]QLG44687.1 hypothetical protein HYG79_04780 [Costertonia aggregata]
MKIIYVLLFSLLVPIPDNIKAQSTDIDLNVLVGQWKIDMSPQDKTDGNFAMMNITKIEGYTFKGEFYREGVKIRNAQINSQLGVIYGALVSGDNSGIYNTSFYYKDGMLHGTTHSVNKNFLAVWTATKSY